MAKWGAQSLMFKSVMGWTDKETPRQRVKSEPHQTWHGDRGPRARSCTSKTLGLDAVLPLEGAENLGITRPRQIKTPITP